MHSIGHLEGLSKAAWKEQDLVASADGIAVRRDRHSEPQNAPTLLLPAVDQRSAGRRRLIPAGSREVRVRQGHIRIGRAWIQRLVHQLDIRGAALGGWCRCRSLRPGLAFGCLCEPRVRRNGHSEGCKDRQPSSKSSYKTHSNDFLCSPRWPRLTESHSPQPRSDFMANRESDVLYLGHMR